MRALITGGAKRLGGLVALDLAQRGWELCVHYHTSSREALELRDQVQGRGGQVQLVEADLASPGGAESLVTQVKHQPWDLVIHSASQWTTDTWLSATPGDWERSHRLHGWSTLVLARLLAEQGHGHLVTLLDARSRDRDPLHFSYAFGKREVLALTRALAIELAPYVRVNGLALGLVLRPDHMPVNEWNDLGRSSTPLQKTVEPSDVLAGLHYLVDTPSVTGQILALDGGRHLKGDLFGSI